MKTLEGTNPSAPGAHIYEGPAESRSGLGRSIVTMVQPAESREGLNLAFISRANFCSATCWRVLRESKMGPVLMVIEQVRRHQTFEMPLVQDDHVVKQVSSATSHPTLSNTVLPPTATG